MSLQGTFYLPKAVELGCCSLGGWRTLLHCGAQGVLVDGRTWEAVINQNKVQT